MSVSRWQRWEDAELWTFGKFRQESTILTVMQRCVARFTEMACTALCFTITAAKQRVLEGVVRSFVQLATLTFLHDVAELKEGLPRVRHSSRS